MKIFVESIDKGIWDSIENGPFIPKLKKNGSFIAKHLGPNGSMKNVRWPSLIVLLKT